MLHEGLHSEPCFDSCLQPVLQPLHQPSGLPAPCKLLAAGPMAWTAGMAPACWPSLGQASHQALLRVIWYHD